MGIFNFITGIFSKEEAEPEVNNTSHPNPIYDNLPGSLFRQEFSSHKNAVLLDVRTGMEVKMGTLPGAIHIDVTSLSFNQKIAKLDKSKTYFVYCRSGNRSNNACQIMHKQGFDVRNLLGGMGAYPQ